MANLYRQIPGAAASEIKLGLRVLLLGASSIQSYRLPLECGDWNEGGRRWRRKKAFKAVKGREAHVPQPSHDGSGVFFFSVFFLGLFQTPRDRNLDYALY